MDANTLAQYNAQLPHSISAIQQTAGGNSLGLQNYFSTPSAALNYGQQGAGQMASDAQQGKYNPITAFQKYDPSYQYTIDQAMANVNNNSAAKGLLESGATQQDLLKTSQNLQNQQYQQFSGNQNNLFNNYQNQLATMASTGMSMNGANQANNNSQALAQLLSQNTNQAGTNIGNANVTTGQGISNNQMVSSATIAQLLQQLGVNTAGMNMNTAAAQANNIFQGNQFQAQIDAEIMNQNAQSNATSRATQGAQNVGNSSGSGINSTSGGLF